jgi:hypothetical protein
VESLCMRMTCWQFGLIVTGWSSATLNGAGLAVASFEIGLLLSWSVGDGVCVAGTAIAAMAASVFG